MFNLYFLQAVVTLFLFNFFNIFIRFNFLQSILYSYYFVVFISILISFFNLFKIVFQTKGFLISFQYGFFLYIYRKIFKRWYKGSIYRCFYCKDLMSCFFFFIRLFYKFKYSFKKEIVDSF